MSVWGLNLVIGTKFSDLSGRKGPWDNGRLSGDRPARVALVFRTVREGCVCREPDHLSGEGKRSDAEINVFSKFTF